MQYLLVVEGEREQVDAFVDQVRDPFDEKKVFVPARAVRVPEQLEEAALEAVPYYLLFEGRYEEAADLLEDLGEDERLQELLRDSTRRREVAPYLRANLSESIKQQVQRIRRNMRQCNALGRRQWLQRSLGKLSSGLSNVTCSRPVDEQVLYRFDAAHLDLTIFDALVAAHPRLALTLVAVDSANAVQAAIKVSHEGGQARYAGAQEAVLDGELTWLEKLPASLA